MICRHCFQRINDGSEICPLCKWPQKAMTITLNDLDTDQRNDSYAEKTECKTFVSDEEYMYCRKCGNKIMSDSAFCNKCGTPTNVDTNASARNSASNKSLVKCSRCGGHHIRYDTVTEDVPAGCSTGCLYVLLALTILGLLIVIPLMLRKRTETVTYAICLDCGSRWKV